jgi:hypothetical protein
MLEPIKVVADILLNELVELDLKPDQVLLYNQKFDIPADDRPYLSVSVLGTRTFGASTRYENDAESNELIESQNINRQEMLSILFYSRGNSARVWNWLIPAALVSTYSEQQQEANGIKISKVPSSMTDQSEQDGTAILNRFALTIHVLAAYHRTKPVPFYDSFPGPAVITNS